MPEVEIEDYETRHITREGYACDVCDRGMIDEPLQEDEVTTVLYKPGVHDRMSLRGRDHAEREFRCEEHADVRGPLQYEADVQDRMERYKEIAAKAMSVLTGGLIIAGLFSALAISALAMEQIHPAFVNDPDLVGLQWALSAFGIMIGSCAGGGLIAHVEDNL